MCRSSGCAELAEAMAVRAQDVQALIGALPGVRADAAVCVSGGVAIVTICDDAAGTAEATKRV